MGWCCCLYCHPYKQGKVAAAASYHAHTAAALRPFKEGKGIKQSKLRQHILFCSLQTYLLDIALVLSPPLLPLQTGQSSCGSQLSHSCCRGHCASSKRAKGLQSKQVKLRQSKFFCNSQTYIQLSCWCSRGHCCPQEQYQWVAMGMARVGGLIRF